LAAYSAKRDQTRAISSIIKRSRAESIVRASSTHFAAKCRYASHLSTAYVPHNRDGSQFPRIVRSVSERYPVNMHELFTAISNPIANSGHAKIGCGAIELLGVLHSLSSCWSNITKLPGFAVKRMRPAGVGTDRKVCRSHLAKWGGADTITEPAGRSVPRPTIHRLPQAPTDRGEYRQAAGVPSAPKTALDLAH